MTRSERLEPLEDRAVGPPGSDSRIDVTDWARLGDGSALGFQVHRSVPIRRLDAGMTKPMADRDEVDTGLKEVDGSGVAEDVRWIRFRLRVGAAEAAAPTYLLSRYRTPNRVSGSPRRLRKSCAVECDST